MERFRRYGRLKSQEPPQKSHLLKFAQVIIKVYQAASRWSPHVRGRKIESIGRAVAEIFQFERRGRSGICSMPFIALEAVKSSKFTVAPKNMGVAGNETLSRRLRGGGSL